jgi:hypothetical protein
MNPFGVAAAEYATPLLGALGLLTSAVLMARLARSRAWLESSVRASPFTRSQISADGFDGHVDSLRRTMRVGAAVALGGAVLCLVLLAARIVNLIA